MELAPDEFDEPERELKDEPTEEGGDDESS